MSEKKYQVFISSTFSDLVNERKMILDLLLMADCIPAGMEAFAAADAEQFDIIKKVIDLCDYYVLIIGKRYGSVHPVTGISYTEMEYDYAIEKGVPVLVFAIDDGVEVASDKCESDPQNIQKLKDFRTKAMKNRLASIWKSSEDLSGKLAVSIMKAKTEINRPGWQRATDFDEASLRREIMELTTQNQKLGQDLRVANDEIANLTTQTNIAFENKEVSIDYHYFGSNSMRISSTAKTNLVEIFDVVATQMLDVSITEYAVEKIVKEKFCYHIRYGSGYINDPQLIKKLLNQFRALGLMTSTWGKEQKTLYWGLTKKGEKVRDDHILLRQ